MLVSWSVGMLVCQHVRKIGILGTRQFSKRNFTPTQQTCLFTAFWRNCEQNKANDPDAKEPLFYDPQAPILLEQFLDKETEKKLFESPFHDEVVDLLAVRTRFIDDFILKFVSTTTETDQSESDSSDGKRCTNNPGFKQLVLLGAGMDTRAYRLDLPNDWIVVEVDSDMDVLQKKHEVLQRFKGPTKFKPTVKKVGSVECNIESEPGKAMAQCFNGSEGLCDDKRPTIFVLEGLLEYLDPNSHLKLFTALRRSSTNINPKQLSRLGSRIVLQCLEPSFGDYISKMGIELPYKKLVTAEEMTKCLAKGGWENVIVYTAEDLVSETTFPMFSGRKLPPGFCLIEATSV